MASLDLSTSDMTVLLLFRDTKHDSMDNGETMEVLIYVSKVHFHYRLLLPVVFAMAVSRAH